MHTRGLILRNFADLVDAARRGTLVAYIANNMDPDQTASLGAVLSGFIVFACKED